MKKDISPYFWPNGTMPNSREFDDLVAEEFSGDRLRIGGLVEAPREFSLADLKAMPKQEQITRHFCIQGWSGVAEWGGVAMRDILDLGEAKLRRTLPPCSIHWPTVPKADATMTYTGSKTCVTR
jgi:DMSO/TMAO reductase YedYZ molybdopterin-dependent catalytic subunit